MEHGHEAFYAGGCVRDMLLGLEPKDYDVVTDAVPEEVSRIFRRTVEVGAAFGVVRVLIGDVQVEVATYRREGGYSDGRRPDSVHYSKSKEEDVHRRDFTINALLMNPESEEVLDFVGGRADLGKRIVRAVGDAEQRFAEDRLRMLRAVRFACRLDFEIDEKTLDAMHLHGAELRGVSVERIVTEVSLMWQTKQPGRAFDLIRSTGLIRNTFPFLHVANEVEIDRASLRQHRLYGATRGLSSAEDRAAVAWAGLLDAAGLNDVEDELRKAKLSRDLMRNVGQLLRSRDVLLAGPGYSAEPMRIASSPRKALHLAFLETLVGPDADLWRDWRALSAEVDAHPLPELPMVSGEDLKSLGFSPGPQFKQILAEVEVEVLERRIADKPRALEWIRSRFTSQ